MPAPEPTAKPNYDSLKKDSKPSSNKPVKRSPKTRQRPGRRWCVALRRNQHCDEVHRLSFTGTVQRLLMFTTQLLQAEVRTYDRSLSQLYKVVVTNRVGNRSDRVDPRAIKRRKKSYPRLSKPRKLL